MRILYYKWYMLIHSHINSYMPVVSLELHLPLCVFGIYLWFNGFIAITADEWLKSDKYRQLVLAAGQPKCFEIAIKFSLNTAPHERNLFVPAASVVNVI